MLKNLLISLVVLCSALVGSIAFLPVSAQAADCNSKGTAFLGLPTWYEYLEVKPDDNGNCNVEVPKYADGKVDLGATVLRVGAAIFEIILRFGGLIAVVFVIVGGFQYITSQGEPEQLKHARGTIMNALIGLAITISASVIVNLVAGIFT